MSRKLFGTDGVRGVANEKLTPELTFSLGLAAGQWLVASGKTRRAVIGRDTRQSGPMLGAALASGLCSAGVEVVVLGVVPTPTVSFYARTEDFGLGAVVSASHNPAPDNGIKFLGHNGKKLTDEQELAIEANLGEDRTRPVGAGVGWLSGRTDSSAYLEFLETILPEGLDKLKVAVDCAHGAAHALGPAILRRLGADVVETGSMPDGMNINAEGGATKPATITRLVLESKADVGVAFDGDADRAVFCDEEGALINGDRTIGAWAIDRKRAGKLNPAVAVGTVMTNGGLEALLQANDIRFERTSVGDKYVSERIEATGALVGGEQSGHVIFSERGPTGDGLVTMLEFLGVLRRSGQPASAITSAYEPWPQVLFNLELPQLTGWNEVDGVANALRDAETMLNGEGRIVARPSGTQPMIRIMVESKKEGLRDEAAKAVVSAMEEELSARIYSRVELTHALGD